MCRPQRSVRIEIVLAAIVLTAATAIHFAVPMTVTYDTAHYHAYLPILRGQEPWTSWDVGRGPGFPALLFLAQAMAGETHLSAAILSYFFLLVALASMALLIRRCFSSPRQRVCVLLLAWSVVLLNPIVVGYFHALLTEFVAATLFLFFVWLADVWACTPWRRGSRAKFTLLAGSFAAGAVAAYFVKQPYVGAALFPLLGAAAYSIVRDGRGTNVASRLFAVLGLLVALAVCVGAWQEFLPESPATTRRDRTSAGLMSRQLVHGLRDMLRVERSVKDLTPAELDNRSFLDAAEAEQIARLRAGEPAASCSHLVAVIDPSRGGEVLDRRVLSCAGESPSIRESAAFVGGVLLAHPWLALRSYARGYSLLTNATPKARMRVENETVAMRPFRIGGGNVVGRIPASLRAYVAQYFVARPAPPWLRASGSALYGLASIAFVLSLTVLPAVFLALCVCLAITRLTGRAAGTRGPIVRVAFIASATGTAHMLAHVTTGMTLDRYAFPVYPLALTMAAIVGSRAVLLAPSLLKPKPNSTQQ